MLYKVTDPKIKVHICFTESLRKMLKNVDQHQLQTVPWPNRLVKQELVHYILCNPTNKQTRAETNMGSNISSITKVIRHTHTHAHSGLNVLQLQPN